MNKNVFLATIIIVVAVFATGCSKKGCTDSCASNYDSTAKKDDESCVGCTDPDASNYCAGAIVDDGACVYDHIQLTFSFVHKIGTETTEFDTIKYINTAGNNYSVATLKYFISDITLHKSGGGTVLIDAEHYVDASDNTTITFTPDNDIPNDSYSQITFLLGIHPSKNITGAFPNPPESNMEWPVPMGGGYHYMKLEGKLDSSGVVKNYQAHTGQSMGSPYYVNVTLPTSSFTADGINLTVEMIMDLNQWWASPNTIDLNNVTSMMGNQAMQQLLMENGADVFSVGSIQ